MSRNKDYQRMLNSVHWKRMRQQYFQHHPLCEDCLLEGKYTAAVDLHHITPVESATTLAEMEKLCYDWNNVRALCIPCHIKVHSDAKSHSKEAHQQRQDDRLARWINRQKNQ